MKHILLIFLIPVLLGSCNSNKMKQKQQKDKIAVDTTGYSLKSLDNLHERLTLKDYDKSLIDYINSNPNRVDSAQKSSLPDSIWEYET